MKIFKSILFIYNILFSFTLLLAGMYFKIINNTQVLLWVIIPLVAYFWLYLWLKSISFKNIKCYMLWFLMGLLAILNLLSTTILLISSILMAKSMIEIEISFLYIPFPIYFLITILDWSKKIKQRRILIKKIKKEEVVFNKKIDLDRRRFLKILGTTGVSVFLLSLLNPKQAGAAFFGSVPGPGTIALKDSNDVKINPAEKQPTDGYKISQIDSEYYPHYYGFVHNNSGWYIMREEESGSFRYCKGSSDFSTNWTSRSSLTYDYYDTVFSVL